MNTILHCHDCVSHPTICSMSSNVDRSLIHMSINTPRKKIKTQGNQKKEPMHIVCTATCYVSV